MFPHIFTNFLLSVHSPLLYFYIPDIRLLQENQITNNLIVDIQNIERAKNKLPLLVMDPTLTVSAKQKACEIEKTRLMSHNNFYKKIYQNGYNKKASVGENLASDLNEIETVYGWINCNSHKQIILDPVFKRVGVANCGNYVVEHLGS